MSADSLLTVRFAIVGALILAAVLMGIFKREGWGWFLFVAFIMIPTIQPN